MKNFKSIYLYCILSLVMVLSISSCKKNDSGGDGPPSISRIRTVFKSSQTSQAITAFDSTTTDGKIGTSYAIIGNNLSSTKAIYVNGVSIYFNIALSSNTSVQFSMPSTVPFSNDTTSNILTVVTAHGKVSTPFVVEQPLPGITSVDQLAGVAGDVLTITGTTFNGLSGVTIGKVPAQVISNVINTTTQVGVLKVQVPSGVTAGPIVLTTKATKGGGIGTGPLLSSGTSLLSDGVTAAHVANGIFGFSTPIFEDQLESGWYDYGWSNSPAVDQTLKKRGTASIKVSYSGGYDGFGFGANDVPVSKDAAVKFSLYGGKDTKDRNVHVILNGNFNISVQIPLVEGKWTDYIIPIANFVDAKNPLPTIIKGLVFQEFSGNASVFNIDDVGIVDIKK
ncbi:hypothetical protein [Mucilaginibacter sp.]|uniref:hypothetical protein n=1 Tax=Mucilaginibacter sp. TaxID=1882438 RepID=UPI002ED3B510